MQKTKYRSNFFKFYSFHYPKFNQFKIIFSILDEKARQIYELNKELEEEYLNAESIFEKRHGHEELLPLGKIV